MLNCFFQTGIRLALKLFPPEPYKQCTPPSCCAKVYVAAAYIPVWCHKPKSKQSSKNKLALAGQRSRGHWFFRAVAGVYWWTGNATESCQVHALSFSFKTEESPEFSHLVCFALFFSLQIARQQQGLAQSLSCWDTSGQAGWKVEKRPINHFFPAQWLQTTTCWSQAERCTMEGELQRILEYRPQVTHREVSWDWVVDERLETAGRTG